MARRWNRGGFAAFMQPFRMISAAALPPLNPAILGTFMLRKLPIAVGEQFSR